LQVSVISIERDQHAAQIAYILVSISILESRNLNID